MIQAFVECYPDELFIRFLFNKVKKKGKIEHARSKSRVIRKVSRYPKSFGLVDEDPGSAVPREFERMREILNNQELKILAYEDINNHSRLLVLSPKFEDWLLRLCKLSKIAPEKFGLPKDPSALQKIINQRMNNLSKLLEELYRSSRYLRKVIKTVNQLLLPL